MEASKHLNNVLTSLIICIQDTFFPNEKKSFFHTATSHNSFLRIDPDGRVFTSQRLTVTATCPMNLKLFPMDTQECRLEIESYGYTTDDIGKLLQSNSINALVFRLFLVCFDKNAFNSQYCEANVLFYTIYV